MSKYKYKLYGAILGDLVGQPYEYKNNGDYSEVKLYNKKSHITDDTLMTLATAKAILENTSFGYQYKQMFFKYPKYQDLYGDIFKRWCNTVSSAYNNSFGNGCLMRFSPLMYAPYDLNRILESAQCSHNHAMSIKSVLRLHDIYLVGAIQFKSFNPPKENINAVNTMDFCESVIFSDQPTKDSILFAVKRGGDTDTNASIIGEAINCYRQDLTKKDAEYVESKLDPYLLKILHTFNEKF